MNAEQLSKQAQQEFSGWEFDGGRVEMNREDNRLQAVSYTHLHIV